jgi:pimeloyl-ACP methyl ester carboxylesterase
VLSHGRAEPLPPALGEGVADAYEATWQQLQASLAGLSTRGRRTVIAESGHNIPTEAPDAVVTAVLELVRPEPARAIA